MVRAGYGIYHDTSVYPGIAFGAVTIYTVIVAAVNLWQAATGTSILSLELLTGFILFPLALNLLTADTMHELMEEAIGR